MPNINFILAIISLIVAIGGFIFGISETFFINPEHLTDTTRTWFDKYFHLLIGGGLGLYMLKVSWEFYNDAISERPIQSSQSPLKNNSISIEPETINQETKKIIKQLGDFGIYLAPDQSREAFITSFSDEYAHQYRHNSPHEITAYDVLSHMTLEIGEVDSLKTFSEDVVKLYWDVEEEPGYYRDYALALAHLAKGKLPLEAVEDIALNQDDYRYERELRFNLHNKKYVFPFEVEGKSLNYDLLCKLGELLHQNHPDNRFAVFGDGYVICLKKDQLKRFNQFIGYEAEWMDEAG